MSGQRRGEQTMASKPCAGGGVIYMIGLSHRVEAARRDEDADAASAAGAAVSRRRADDACRQKRLSITVAATIARCWLAQLRHKQ